jgi:NAD(P)-dependent dehydrogenase (short-subunit alcohol dehydrogenase family)
VSDALRQEVSPHGVDVAVVEPGYVATDFYDRALAEIESIQHTPAYDDLYRVLDDIGIVQRGGPGINRPERVAEAILEAATAERPDAVYRVGAASILSTYLGAVVRGRSRDVASRVGIRAISSGPAQKLLRKLGGGGATGTRDG